MSRYSGLLNDPRIRDMLSQLKPVPRAKCEELRTEYPELRPDYLDFLSEVGYGVIGQRQYMLYSGVVPLSELLTDACDPNWTHLLAFGDTTGGTCHAFDPFDGMRVIAIDLDIREVEGVASSFESCLRTLLASFIEETPEVDPRS
ncbi:MAG: hypothetical protein L0241_08600 [Planctomycetia bacterium]|nr:hypothetical protein [Planctomycetia bacterium]